MVSCHETAVFMTRDRKYVVNAVRLFGCVAEFKGLEQESAGCLHQKYMVHWGFPSQGFTAYV